MKAAVGIDLGSRAIKGVLYDMEERRIAAVSSADTTPDHKADAADILQRLLADGEVEKSDVAAVMTTGYGRYLADLNGEATTEITCQAEGVLSILPKTRTIIDIGGQDSKAIYIDSGGRVRDFAMNDRCAAGTGRFLEVVAKILRIDVEGMAALAGEARGEQEISSTCVVFAESEVIGLLSQGVAKADIAAGIHRAIARRVAGLAERGRYEPPVAFTGGVAMNRAMVQALGAELKLKTQILVPEDPRITGALGAALLAAGKMGGG